MPPFLRSPAGRGVASYLARRLGFSPGLKPSERAVDRVLKPLATTTHRHLRLSRDADYGGMSGLHGLVGTHRYGAVRNEDFYRWRLGKPIRTYRFLYWMDSRIRGFIALAWKGPSPHKIMIADYAVEEDAVFQEMLTALARTEGTEIALMSATLPDSHLRSARELGFLPDPTYQKEIRRRFLFYPLTAPNSPNPLAEACSTFPEGWALNLLDTMNP